MRLSALTYAATLLIFVFYVEDLHAGLRDYWATDEMRAKGKVGFTECGNVYDTILVGLAMTPWLAMCSHMAAHLFSECLNCAVLERSATPLIGLHLRCPR